MAYSIVIDRIRCALFVLTAILFLVGCARVAEPVSECDSSPLRALRTALGDEAFKHYANAYLANGEDLVLIWDDMPSNTKQCKAGERSFLFTKTSELPVKNRNRYIAVTKMYYDEDAAFVELMLYPTGMNAEFFMRNKSGWKVVQRDLWESRKR